MIKGHLAWSGFGALGIAVGAGLAATALLGGCGGAESSSADDFIAAADEICERSDAEFAELQQRPARTPVEAERLAAALAAVYSDALDELAALEPPADLADLFDHYLSARERVIGYLEEAERAAAEENLQDYLAARGKATSELAERLQLAQDVGLRRCSRPPLSLGGVADDG